MTDKIDFKKTPAYRAKRDQFDVIEVPSQQYLMIDGTGDPNTAPAYVQALESLYPVAYTLKFVSKLTLGRDYVVPPLEGLWWADDMRVFTERRDKSKWSWTLMLLVPEWITEAMYLSAVEKARAKNPPRLDDIRLERLDEGTCVQTLHVGSFDDEAEILRRLHDEVIPEHGFVMSGRHHEIYLSDFRRVEQAKLRTILRQPVVVTP